MRLYTDLAEDFPLRYIRVYSHLLSTSKVNTPPGPPVRNRNTPVEIHVYGLRYKPGKVLVYERGELVYETYTGAGSGQKREAALTVQDFLETLGVASRIIRHNAPPPRQIETA